MVDIEKTLSDLALAMQDHRDALAEREAASHRRPAPIERLRARIEALTGWRIDATIEARLVAALGSIGGVERAARLSALDTLDWDDPAWLALIETLATGETYLFRDAEQFDLLAAELAPAIAAAGGAAARPALRLWSAGCASGEEAYSLAVCVLDALVRAGAGRESADEITLAPPSTLEVLGSDISRVALAQARAGVYATGPLSSFRATPEPLMRFFPPADTAPGCDRRVRPDVGRHVRFSHANLMRTGPPAHGFDVVACRNVLVYFTPAARERALAVLEAAVRPGGLLLLGPTDTRPDARRFEAVWGAHAVLYRRRT